MKNIFFFIFICITVVGFGQVESIPEEVPYGKDPVMPSQKMLDAIQPINFDLLKEKVDTLSNRKLLRTYFLNNSLYNGWALQIFLDTDHRYRYMKFDNGLVVWQVGFYDDGTPDLDFHAKDGKGLGSQRMWTKGGGLYIDTFYIEGDVPHGPQFRWYSNGEIARDAYFNKGELVYEILFDITGSIKNHKGTIPFKYRPLLPKDDSGK